MCCLFSTKSTIKRSRFSVLVTAMEETVKWVRLSSPTVMTVMTVIRHAGVDSRMILLDDQLCQQLTCHLKLSLQCNVSPITGLYA